MHFRGLVFKLQKIKYVKGHFKFVQGVKIQNFSDFNETCLKLVVLT